MISIDETGNLNIYDIHAKKLMNRHHFPNNALLQMVINDKYEKVLIRCEDQQNFAQRRQKKGAVVSLKKIYKLSK